MRTDAEITALKTSWAADPCWDLEYTEGFEEHAEELKTYRIEQEASWEADRTKKLEPEDMEKIDALASVIVAKVLDEVSPKSEQVSLSDVALGALACKWAAQQLAGHATQPLNPLTATERKNK